MTVFSQTCAAGCRHFLWTPDEILRPTRDNTHSFSAPIDPRSYQPEWIAAQRGRLSTDESATVQSVFQKSIPFAEKFVDRHRDVQAWNPAFRTNFAQAEIRPFSCESKEKRVKANLPVPVAWDAQVLRVTSSEGAWRAIGETQVYRIFTRYAEVPPPRHV